jgi:hypothetical protein
VIFIVAGGAARAAAEAWSARQRAGAATLRYLSAASTLFKGRRPQCDRDSARSRPDNDPNEEAVRQSASIRPRRTWTAIVQETHVENCPFCVSGIRHVRHVPSGSVRVGQDFGDVG